MFVLVIWRSICQCARTGLGLVFENSSEERGCSADLWTGWRAVGRCAGSAYYSP